MGEDSKPKSLTDDIEDLFDLVKEGASYLLHFYLYFFSKTFPLEFIENLFDHHKEKSSYDYSKDGKTYIYRLCSCVFEVEKQVVAMGLQYIYSYIPLPFFKNIYENFCVNNNLECTDVKLKKCKKALINSTKDAKKKQEKPKSNNEDDDLVSRPFPLFPQTPKSKTENTVSLPLSITSNSGFSLRNTNDKRSLKNSMAGEIPSSPIGVPSNPDNGAIKTPIPTPLKNSTEIPTSSQLNNNSRSSVVSNSADTANLKAGQSSEHSESYNNYSSLTVPSSSLKRKPSKIPRIRTRPNLKLQTSVSPQMISEGSLSSLISHNPLKLPNDKPSNTSLQDNSLASSTIRAINEKKDSQISKNNTEVSFPPKINIAPVSRSPTEDSTVQNLSKSNASSPKFISNSTDLTIPTTKTIGSNLKANPDSFADLAKVLNSLASSYSSTDDSSLFPNPFASSTTPSDSSRPNSLLSNPENTFSIPLNKSPSRTEPSMIQSTGFKAKKKNNESVAPVSKNIQTSIESGNSLEQTIEQNNKAFQKNIENFGKSITDAFSGGFNAPTPGPSAMPSSRGSQHAFCLENMESYNRILNIPIVTSGINIAEVVYMRIKKTNNMLSWTLDQAEDTIRAVTHNPAIGMLETPLSTIDRAICKSLDIVESRIPSINLPPKMIYSHTKDYLTEVSTKIVKPVLKRADSVKQIGNNVLSSKYTEYAADKLDDALDVADAYIDKYFPDQEDSKDGKDRDILPSATNSRALHTMKHVDRVSKKLQRRLTKRTLEHAKLIKEQGTEAIHVLLYVAELIVTDPKLALQKGKELWGELSKNEPENQARPKNIEELFVLVVRESARCLVHLINYSNAKITKLPRIIVKTVDETKTAVVKNTRVLVQSIPFEELEKFLADAIKFVRQEIKSFTYQVLEQARRPEPIAHTQPVTIALAVPKIEINSKAANSKPNSNSNNQVRQRRHNDHHGQHSHVQHGNHGHDQHDNHGQKKNGAHSPSRRREYSETKEN